MKSCVGHNYGVNRGKIVHLKKAILDMCGILALLSSASISNEDHRNFAAQQASLLCRGPDGTGASAVDRCLLFHSRLAIVDPTGGGQPLHLHQHGLVLVCNGVCFLPYSGSDCVCVQEIYNHDELRQDCLAESIFSSNSDSEVILHLYARFGAKLLPLLDGEFAFVLWDRQHNRLLAARDPLGVKYVFVRESRCYDIFGTGHSSWV